MQTEATTNSSLTETFPTISQIVRDDYRTADVFKKWGINYCCGGNLPLAEACALRKVDVAALQEELDAATKTVALPSGLQFGEWPLIFLIDYIVHVHHGYLKKVLPALNQSLTSFVSGHTKKYPYLVEVEETFASLALELTAQMAREEESVFPYLRQISHTADRRETYGSLFVRTMRQPLSDVAGKDRHRTTYLLQLLRKQTNDYSFNANACTNHQVIYHKLKELDADMVHHKHLENNILFPRAIEIERSLLGV